MRARAVAAASRLPRLLQRQARLAGGQSRSCCSWCPAPQAHATVASRVVWQQAVQQQRLSHQDGHVWVQRAAQAAQPRLLQWADHRACAMGGRTVWRRLRKLRGAQLPAILNRPLTSRPMRFNTHLLLHTSLPGPTAPRPAGGSAAPPCQKERHTAAPMRCTRERGGGASGLTGRHAR